MVIIFVNLACGIIKMDIQYAGGRLERSKERINRFTNKKAIWTANIICLI